MTNHIEGAGGELVVAEVFHLPWADYLDVLRDPSGEKPADLGDIIEVRNGEKDHYRLIAHDEDPDDRVLILVTGIMPHKTISGWLFGHEAKRREWWTNAKGEPGRDSYFVPQANLRPIESLPAFIKRVEERSA